MSPSDPIEAVAFLRMNSFCISFRDILTTTSPTTTIRTLLMVPIWTPDSHTLSPSLSPSTFLNTAETEKVLLKRFDALPRKKVATRNITTPATTKIPSFTRCFVSSSSMILILVVKEWSQVRVFRLPDLVKSSFHFILTAYQRDDPVGGLLRTTDIVCNDDGGGIVFISY